MWVLSENILVRGQDGAGFADPGASGSCVIASRARRNAPAVWMEPLDAGTYSERRSDGVWSELPSTLVLAQHLGNPGRVVAMATLQHITRTTRDADSLSLQNAAGKRRSPQPGNGRIARTVRCTAQPLRGGSGPKRAPVFRRACEAVVSAPLELEESGLISVGPSAMDVGCWRGECPPALSRSCGSLSRFRFDLLTAL